MIEAAQLSTLGLGFTLGLLHALDADHVMAVSVMANRRPSITESIKFSGRWAMGHGGILVALGILLVGLGVQLPQWLGSVAEQLVGVLLIALGGWLLWQIRRQRLSFAPHYHGDLYHLHAHQPQEHAQRGEHTPLFVGMLHGVAGSAPVLAVLPAVSQGEAVVAVAYLLLFSLGVALSMLVFGLGLGAIQRFLQVRSIGLFDWMRRLIAISAIGFGGYWLGVAG